MKRLHVNLAVKNIEESIAFYNAMFGQEPTVVKPDYAKWQVEDPRVNFAISLKGENHGLNHLGIETENANELEGVYKNIAQAKGEVREEGHTVCCYAHSEKSWIKDPQGIEWEAFRTYGSSEVNQSETSDCCAPTSCC